MAEYQTFTNSNATLRIWASEDRGRTWSTRATFTASRHAHGMVADPARHALWVYFGDTTPQCGIYRSTDAGRTWTKLLSNQEADVVDATVLPNGDLLFGQDISYLPELPSVARLTPTGGYTALARIVGPSYSIQALRGGGFVVGSAHEPGGDIYPAGDDNAYLYGSPDGVSWKKLLTYARNNSSETGRIDVYFQLPSGELVLRLDYVTPGTHGYQLLQPTLR